MHLLNLPEQDRPRERLLSLGAVNLTDAELLAIVVGTGFKGKSALDVGQEILDHFGSLTDFFAASRDSFNDIKGLGTVRYAQLQAMFELTQRALIEKIRQGESLSSPEIVKQFLKLNIGFRSYESFNVIFLDVKNRLIRCEELSKGTIDQAAVYPREVLKRAIQLNAASVILAHNHPSGNTDPSKADIHLTQVLKQALALLDIRVLDHIIVAIPHCYSFAEHGNL